MKYRTIRRCNNIKVSEVALGCEGFLGKSAEEFKAMLDRAMELGINFIDMYTSNPDFRNHLGAAIAGRREKIVLQGHICSVWENGQYLRTRNLEKTKAAFEDQLKRIGTDFIDIGMIHYVDSESDFEEVFHGEIIEYCRQLKAEGKIHAIGLSSHNPIVARKAVETGFVDVLMFSVNAAYDMQPASEDCNDLWAPESYKNQLEGMNPDRKALYELCERENVAIDVMKAFGGGDMLKAELSHMDKFKFHGNCMYCGHCAPCTVGINVADINKYLNLALARGEVPETVADHYKLLEHHASECVACRKCEENCPFGVAVVERMEKAAQVFGY